MEASVLDGCAVFFSCWKSPTWVARPSVRHHEGLRSTTFPRCKKETGKVSVSLVMEFSELSSSECQVGSTGRCDEVRWVQSSKNTRPVLSVWPSVEMLWKEQVGVLAAIVIANTGENGTGSKQETDHGDQRPTIEEQEHYSSISKQQQIPHPYTQPVQLVSQTKKSKLTLKSQSNCNQRYRPYSHPDIFLSLALLSNFFVHPSRRLGGCQIPNYRVEKMYSCRFHFLVLFQLRLVGNPDTPWLLVATNIRFSKYERVRNAVPCKAFFSFGFVEKACCWGSILLFYCNKSRDCKHAESHENQPWRVLVDKRYPRKRIGRGEWLASWLCL